MKKITALTILITTLSTSINAQTSEANPSADIEQTSEIETIPMQTPPAKPVSSDRKNWIIAGMSLVVATVAAVVVSISQGAPPHDSGR